MDVTVSLEWNWNTYVLENSLADSDSVTADCDYNTHKDVDDIPEEKPPHICK